MNDGRYDTNHNIQAWNRSGDLNASYALGFVPCFVCLLINFKQEKFLVRSNWIGIGLIPSKTDYSLGIKPNMVGAAQCSKGCDRNYGFISYFVCLLINFGGNSLQLNIMSLVSMRIHFLYIHCDRGSKDSDIKINGT